MKKQLHLLVAILTVLNLNLSLNAQVAVNTTGADANSSAMLDVSSTSKGILIPRMTLSQRNDISDPVTGLMIFQTDNTPGFYFYNGTGWVVVGSEATTINSLNDGVSDGSSVFLGNGAGENDDGTTNNNTGTGIYSLKEVTSGDYNSAFGTEALKVVTTGTYNVGFGRASLFSNVSGQHNTAIGSNAGYFVTGSDNILIGYNAAFNETAINNKLFIENSASSTPLIYGEFDNDLLRINGILDINNAYQLPIADGTSGQTLKTNGSGSLSWSDDTNTGATNINELGDAATDNSSLFLGIDAGANDDGTINQNTGVGISSLNAVTNGNENTATGYEALKAVTTGHHNTAFGRGALSSLTTGYDNVAIGVNAGSWNTGNKNIFIGANAGVNEPGSNKLYIENTDGSSPLIYGDFSTNLLRINGTLDINNAYQFPLASGTNGQLLKTDGSGNLSWADDTNTGATSINELSDAKTGGYSVFLGEDCGNTDDGSYNYNNALGYQALYKNTTGSYNVAIGKWTMFENNTGYKNVAIGSYANDGNEEGSENTIIGHEAGGNRSPEYSASGCIFLGYNAGYDEKSSNKLYIENSSSSSPLIYGEFDNNMLKINGTLELLNGTSASSLKFFEPSGSGSNYTIIQSQAQVANVTYTLPAADGSDGQVLKTNGNGNLSWTDDAISYSVGDFAHGGIVFWVDESGQHGLVCTKVDQSASIHWYNGSYVYTQSSGDGIGSGEMNTMLIVAAQGYNSNDYAAGICVDLTVTENSINYGDWYLPSLTELTEIYNNRTVINATAVANGGTALSTTGSYWTSVEITNGHAYIKKFHDGGYLSTLKNYTNFVRAVRKF